MLSCYLLAVCQLSTIDETNKAPSLYNLIESVALVPFPPAGSPIAVELHAYFEADEADRNVAFDTKLVWVLPSGAVWRNELPPQVVILGGPRLRIRAANLFIPPTAGAYHIHMEARRVGDQGDRQRISPVWPIELLDALPPGTVPPPTPPVPGGD